MSNCPSDSAATPGNGGNAAPHAGLIEWFRRHTRSILFLMVIAAVAGVLAAFALPVALFPKVSFPRIAVSLDAGDQPAERMAIQVTYPVEEALRAIPGVRRIRSTTSRGSADVAVDFDWGHDMTAALLQVESEINKFLPQLPPGTTFEATRRDPTVFPVVAYSLTSDTQSLVALRDLAYYQLRPVLTTVTSVARVEVQGGAQAEYRVVANIARLRAFNLSVSDLANALSAANVLAAVGKLEDHDKLYLLISDTRLRDATEIAHTIVRTGPDGVVRLSDLATVENATVPQWTRVTADGHDAVLLQVYQQPDGNTVQIASEIKAKLASLKASIPPGVTIANWYDQSDLILASASSVRDAVLVGIGLAALVLLAFLRNWKVTLIAVIAVPAVLASTILLLYVLGMSFNIMTLGGMAAAVGLIIDDAIVMVEHIVRRLRETGGPNSTPRQRVAFATAEFTRPLTGSSAATIIIFAPLAFLSGVTGAFFKALSLTMASALIISFLIAWLVVPVLAVQWLSRKDAEKEEHGPVSRLMRRGYGFLMSFLLRVPWLALLFITLLVAGGYFAYQATGSGFMPAMDEGGFILDYVAPPGTSLAETDRLLRQVERILRSTLEVQTYSRRTGLQLGGGLTEPNTGDFFVRLKGFPRRPIEEVMDDVRARAQHQVPGLYIETFQLMEDLIGDLTSVPQPVEIKLFSDSQQTLDTLAPKVANAISKVKGIDEVKDGIVLAGDAIDIHVDRAKAALDGLDPDTVTRNLQALLSGLVATQVQEGPKLVGIHVWVPHDTRTTDLDLKHLTLSAPDGHLVPLQRIATLVPVTGQPEIDREDLKRMVAVTARVVGRDMGSAVAEVQQLLQEKGLIPPGVYTSMGGLYQQQRIAFRGLTIVLVAAVLLVFLLLLFMYESFRVALGLLSTALLALAAVFVGLYLTGTELNIASMMGMTMVVGIVTEVSIFYYSEYHDLPDAMARTERLRAAGRNRMRPILMTTVAAILALLPLALGLGQGAAMQQPLAIAIICGLIAQAPLVLIVMPMLLRVLGA